jgi:hypothetical protein
MSDIMLDVGQANELKLAFRKADYENSDVKRLCEDDLLEKLRLVMHGYADVKMIVKIVDLDADPLFPRGCEKWTVKSHVKQGSFQWNPQQVAFCPFQIEYPDEIDDDVEIYTLDCELRKQFMERLGTQPVFNATLLDFLLSNKMLIPKEWRRNEVIFFPATHYIDLSGRERIRGLQWTGFGWVEATPCYVDCIDSTTNVAATLKAIC